MYVFFSLLVIKKITEIIGAYVINLVARPFRKNSFPGLYDFGLCLYDFGLCFHFIF